MTIPLLGILDGWALLVLRLVVALIILVSGWTKIKHLKELQVSFESMLKSRFGAFLAPLTAFVELLGGIALLVGFFTQFAAVILALLIASKIGYRLIRRSGAKLNLEIDLLLLASLIVLTVLGGGFFGLDIFLPQLPF